MRSRVPEGGAVRWAIVVWAFAVLAAWSATSLSAAPIFYGTGGAGVSAWTVAYRVAVNRAGDGQFSSFPTDGFNPAVAETNRGDFISNNTTGTNGSMEDWTFFVFRQTFDLTGYDPATAALTFRWGSDDVGDAIGSWSRGHWVPGFRLNFGDLQGVGTSGAYTYGDPVHLTSGFVSGINTLDFYVQGNGVTDGFELTVDSFTADLAPTQEPQPEPVPEPASLLLVGTGLAGIIARRRRN